MLIFREVFDPLHFPSGVVSFLRNDIRNMYSLKQRDSALGAEVCRKVS